MDVGQDVVEADVLALAAELPPAAVGAHFRRSGDEQLGGRVRRDHRADVAPVDHRARLARGEGALHVQEGAAHPGVHGHPARGLAGCPVAQGGIFQVGDVQRLGHRPGRVLVVKVAACVGQQYADGPVQQPGIQVRQAVRPGEAGRDRPLAGGGRTVDGDHEAHSTLPVPGLSRPETPRCPSREATIFRAGAPRRSRPGRRPARWRPSPRRSARPIRA